MIRKVKGYWFRRVKEFDGEYGWNWMGSDPFGLKAIGYWLKRIGLIALAIFIALWIVR